MDSNKLGKRVQVSLAYRFFGYGDFSFPEIYGSSAAAE